MPKSQEIVPADVIYLKQQVKALEKQLEDLHTHTCHLLDIVRTLHSSLDKQVIAANIINAIVSLIDITQVTVCLFNEKSKTFDVIDVYNTDLLLKSPPKLNQSLLNKVLYDGVTYSHSIQGSHGSEWNCHLPLQNLQHKIGIINIQALRQPENAVKQTEFLETIASHASIALENALFYHIVEQESLTDGLTGVYNYNCFQKRLHEYISLYQRHRDLLSFGLIMIDIDHFKLVNDRFGHQFGDFALQTLAEVLQNNLRKEDLLARYGGEEFALLVSQATTKSVRLISEKIRKNVEQTKIRQPQTNMSTSVTISIGSTIYRPSDTPYSLISRADQALYKAKLKGRNQCVFQ